MLQLNAINWEYKKGDYMADGHLLRIAYLLSDKLIIAGQGHFMIAHEQHCQNPSAFLKKHMVLRYAGQMPDPQYLKEVQSLYDTLKKARQVKHEPSSLIIARKRIEKALDNLYQNSVDWLTGHYTQLGYTGLYMLENTELIGEISEAPDEKETRGLPYSKILSNKWNQSDEIYAFTIPFWQYTSQNGNHAAPALEAAENTGILLFRLPDTPALNTLTTAELKLLKHEVFTPLQEMRQNLADWSANLSKESFGYAHFSTYRQAFNQHIQPHLTTLQNNINTSPILQKLNAASKGLIGHEHYLAVTSARTMWDYMEWGELVPKESMHLFEQHLPAGASPDKAVLLFVSKPFNDLSLDDDSDKKSLQL